MKCGIFILVNVMAIGVSFGQASSRNGTLCYRVTCKIPSQGEQSSPAEIYFKVSLDPSERPTSIRDHAAAFCESKGYVLKYLSDGGVLRSCN